MSNLTISGTQSFMGNRIPVVSGGFGKDKKCMSDKTIAEIHNMEPKHVRERIVQNIKRFKGDVDFIDLKQRVGETGTSERAYETSTLELLQNLGYAKQSITQAEHIYILSERGYSKLIKIMDTDLAWEIHDKLMDEYFEMRDTVIPQLATDLEVAKVEAQKARAQAMLLNAKNRTFKTLMESISDKSLSPIAVEVFGLKSLESTFGVNVGQYLPQCETTYSATEIGAMLGITANKVGKIANAKGLKSEKYSIKVMDKSPYSSKEVVSYRYFDNAVDVIKEALSQEASIKH